MAVGYYSGSSTGPNDLIDKFRIAAFAEGWTVNLFTAIGAGYRLHIQKTASDGTVMYFNFRSAIAEYGTLITEDNAGSGDGNVTGLCINGSTGYDVGQDWDTQTNYPQNIGKSNKSFGNVMSPMSTSAIPAYYFYFVGDSVHIVVEITSGKFQFMSFGMLNKQGAITGGLYFTASMSSRKPYYDYQGANNRDSARYFIDEPYASDCMNGAVYLDADSVTDWRVAGTKSTYDEIVFPCVPCGDYSPARGKGGMCSFFWTKSPSAYNAMAAMCPLYVCLKRDDDNYSLIGWPEGVRFLNVTNYDSAEEISYGDETWMVFHADSVEDDPQNMYAGFAFLKDDGS